MVPRLQKHTRLYSPHGRLHTAAEFVTLLTDDPSEEGFGLLGGDWFSKLMADDCFQSAAMVFNPMIARSIFAQQGR